MLLCFIALLLLQNSVALLLLQNAKLILWEGGNSHVSPGSGRLRVFPHINQAVRQPLIIVLPDSAAFVVLVISLSKCG